MFNFPAKRPLIISGPCSVETRIQTLETCLALARSGKVDMIRAGVWKPRTSPGSFEGAGEEGLGWLAEFKKLTAKPLAVEVATPAHIETALKYGIDAVWIGARTTVSPFAVQEIAEALRGCRQVPVLIKNPMNPDTGLWAGAAERFVKVGIALTNIAFIHRGFAYPGHTRYRNSPMWHIALRMRESFPDNIFICDPSHIAGDRRYLREICQNAADLRFDGLMIESHIDPDKALSDKDQQLTPEQLFTLLDSFSWRSDKATDPEFALLLESFRSEIDRIDSEVFELFSRRMELAENIGMEKRTRNVAILQAGRWKDISERFLSQATILGLSPEFINTVLDAIHMESINRQNRVMNN